MTARKKQQVDWSYEVDGCSLADLVRVLWESGLPAAAIWRHAQEMLECMPPDYGGARTTTPAAIQHLIQNRGWQRKNDRLLQKPKLQLPRELVLETERAIITSDWHIPYYHRTLFSRALDLARAECPDLLVIAGDFLDVEAFSILPLLERGEGLKEELTTARDIIDAFLELVPRVALCIGNHEARFVRALRGELDATDFMQMLVKPIAQPERVLATGRAYLVLNATRDGKHCGTWRITHPRSYSRIAPQVERQIAAKVGQHVLGAHGHMFAIGLDISGKYISGQIGGMVDPDLIIYRVVFDTTHPGWTPGFWYLRRGTIYPMTLLREITDWEIFDVLTA